MCGRFDFHGHPIDVATVFAVDVAGVEWRPSYNVAPTQASAVLANDAGALTVEMMRFGFKRVEGGLLINARSETVSRYPSFREAYKTSRCAVLANGFFEWRAENGKKQPYYFRKRDGSLFAFAGLWQHATAEDEPARFLIITTSPNEVVKPYHNRMPVMLSPDTVKPWVFATAQDKELLRSLMSPANSADMECFPVTPQVNSPKNNSPSNIHAADIG